MISRMFRIIVPLCEGTMVNGGFPLQRESNADLWCLTLTSEGRSGDMPLYGPAMAYFSDVVSYWLPVAIWANQQDSIGWLWTVQWNNGVWGKMHLWITVNLRWRSNMNRRQGGAQWRRSAWTVPSQIVPGSGTLKETQRVKPYDQSRLFIWIYEYMIHLK